MRRINIKKDDKLITKSFYDKEDFRKWLRQTCVVHLHYFIDQMCNEIWNLNVGKSITYYGFRFSIQSKARVGNQLVL